MNRRAVASATTTPSPPTTIDTSAPPAPHAHRWNSGRMASASEPKRMRCFEPGGQYSNEEELMRKIAIGLLAGAGALQTGSANASDIYTTSEYTNSDLIQQVRMVCDDNGRCYRTRGESRVIVRDSYALSAARA